MERRQETRRLVAELFQAAPGHGNTPGKAVSGSPRCFKPTDQAQPAATRTALLKLAASHTMLPQYTGPGSSSFKPAAQHTSPPQRRSGADDWRTDVSSQRHSTPRRHRAVFACSSGPLPVSRPRPTRLAGSRWRYSVCCLRFKPAARLCAPEGLRVLAAITMFVVSSPPPDPARWNSLLLLSSPENPAASSPPPDPLLGGR